MFTKMADQWGGVAWELGCINLTLKKKKKSCAKWHFKQLDASNLPNFTSKVNTI